MTKRKMLVADLLCGAGGSSTGCRHALDALGLDMELVCVNHWDTAIETHQINHPTARHFVQDIATVRPHILVPEGYLDLLMASPTCTHHSVARGGKPTSDQQRSDPWHIITWLTELRVKRLIIENVWEFISWGPVNAQTGKPTSDQQRSDPWHIITWLTELRVKRLIIENVWEFISWGPVNAQTGKPVKSRRGEYFHAWIQTIKGLGFDPEWRKLNAADYGDATTRQRFILMARSDGRKVIWPMPANRKISELKNDLFAVEKPWRPAGEIIDWKLKGRSIFGRQKPLAPKTLLRIFAGAVKFGWPEPFPQMLLREIENSLRYQIRWSFSGRNDPKGKVDKVKRRTLARRNIQNLRAFLASPASYVSGGKSTEPLIITLRQNAAGTGIDQPIPTLAANGQHVGLASPVVVNMKKGNQPRDLESPLPTQTSGASHVGVAEPVIMNGRKGNQAKPAATDPLPTLDTKGGVWLAEPMVLSQHSSGVARSTEDPLPTITTGGAAAGEHPGCARPMLVTVAHGNDAREKDPNGRRASSIEEPLGTIHGAGSAFAVVEPFALSQASGGAPRSTEDPLPTITTGGNGASHALISPYYSSGSGETCQSAEDPLPTVTSKGRFGMVVPVTNSNGGAQARNLATDPLPTMTTARGGEFAAVLPVTHEGGTNRVQDVSDPLPTITCAARGEYALVETDQEYDILFRMLEPHELAAAMGLEDYKFAGTKTDQIKQIGNAVSRRKMQACVTAMFSDVARTGPSDLAAMQGFQEAAE